MDDQHVKTDAEIGVNLIANEGTPRNVGNHQKLEKARRDSSLESLEGAWLSQQFDFGLLASRMMR